MTVSGEINEAGLLQSCFDFLDNTQKEMDEESTKERCTKRIDGFKYMIKSIHLPRQYTNRARKPLIFLDFLKLTEKIYYLFTTYQNY